MFHRNLVPDTCVPNTKGSSPQGEKEGKIVMIKYTASWMK